MSAAARALLEAAMVDTCRLERPQGGGSYDPNTGDITPTDPVTIYEGRCMTGAPIGAVTETLRAGVEEYADRYPISIPADAGPPEVGDHVHYLTSTDGQLAGQHLRVVEVIYGTHTARRRMLCVLVAEGPRP